MRGRSLYIIRQDGCCNHVLRDVATTYIAAEGARFDVEAVVEIEKRGTLPQPALAVAPFIGTVDIIFRHPPRNKKK